MFRLCRYYCRSKTPFEICKKIMIRAFIHASTFNTSIIKGNPVTITNVIENPRSNVEIEEYYGFIPNHNTIAIRNDLYNPLHDKEKCFRILKYTPRTYNKYTRKLHLINSCQSSKNG